MLTEAKLTLALGVVAMAGRVTGAAMAAATLAAILLPMSVAGPQATVTWAMAVILATVGAVTLAMVGVAILAGTAIGRFASVQEGARQMVRAQKVYEPDMDKHERYLARYRTFAKIYPALAELSHEM